MIKYIRNLHRSANAFYEKRLNLHQPIIGYRDLLPVDDIQNGDEYLNALSWAFKNKRVKNIALAGPYGAGKSSIIESFLKKHWRIRRRSLRISMASFEINSEICNSTEQDDKKHKTPIEKEEIEHGILKQLFYKVGYGKIPQSRYRKLHKISALWTWVKLIFITLLAIPFVYAFKTEFLTEIKESVVSAGESLNLSEVWAIGIFIMLTAAVLGIISYAYKSLLSRYTIRKVSLPSDTVVEGGGEGDESVFSKYLDEIFYFFEVTRYQYVFFEDLDRLDDPSIFVHLRELNTLLNNYDIIHSKLVFVYAVKDDIFSDEDRTKFFDFIIPVVPIINSTNSGEVFTAMLERARQSGTEHCISQEFILDVSPYISDMRVLQNIYNEFLVYKGTIKAGQELELDDEKMMALIVFKNLYPSEFADLQKEKGVVKRAFEDKRSFIATRQKTAQDEIDRLSTLIEEAKADTLHRTKELKAAFLCEITGWKGTAYCIRLDYSTDVYASEIFTGAFDFLSLARKEIYGIRMMDLNGNNRNASCDNFLELCQIYSRRAERIELVEGKEKRKRIEEIAQLKNQQQNIRYKTMRELLTEFKVDAVLSENVMNNKLLSFMLRRGYLDEDYATYINYFKGTSITKSDMNFILAVKNLEMTEFEYPISKTPQVIQRLQPYEFRQKSIYNYALLEELLGTEGESEKRDLFIEQLSDEDERSWAFIDGFIDVTKNLELFITLLAEAWPRMWLYISNRATLSYERKSHYLLVLVRFIDIDSLVAMNRESSLSHFIEENEDSLQRLASVDADKVYSVINWLDLRFDNAIIEKVPREVVDAIIEESRYGINLTMLKRIVKFLNPDLVAGVENRPYSTLNELECDSILQNVRNHIPEFVNEIVAQGSMDDLEDDVADLLERTIDNAMLYDIVLSHETVCFEDILSCCGNLVSDKRDAVQMLWSALLKEDKIYLSWKNIYEYWEQFKFDKVLLEYIENNSDKLKGQSTDFLDDDFIGDFIASEVDDRAFGELLPELRMQDFNVPLSSLSEHRVLKLIYLKFIPFTVPQYDEMQDCCPNLCEPFILWNQRAFRELINDVSLTSQLIENLVLSKDSENETKIEIINTYGAESMTQRIAEYLCAARFDISQEIFDAAWNMLDIHKQEKLMFMYLAMLDDKSLASCFSDLGGDYADFVDRISRHKVELKCSDNNRRLVQRLKEVDYITSYSEGKSAKKGKDIDQDCKVIQCWIKAEE